jgi:hypothetical protein
MNKYFKFIGKTERDFTNGEWYMCVSNNPLHYAGSFIDNVGRFNGYFPHNDEYFDLSNPQVNKPKPRKLFNEVI